MSVKSKPEHPLSAAKRGARSSQTGLHISASKPSSALRVAVVEANAKIETAVRAVEQLERLGALTSKHPEAVEAFLEGLERHVPEGATLTAADGRRGALAAVSTLVWADALGPLLETEETRELLGLGSRQAVSERVRAHALIAMQDSAGRWRFPAYQFDEQGRPYLPLVDAFWVIHEQADAWTAAAWVTGQDSAFDGLSPLEWHLAGKHEDRIARVARQDAARLGA